MSRRDPATDVKIDLASQNMKGRVGPVLETPCRSGRAPGLRPNSSRGLPPSPRFRHRPVNFGASSAVRLRSSLRISPEKCCAIACAWFSVFFEKAFVSRVIRRECMRISRLFLSANDVLAWAISGLPWMPCGLSLTSGAPRLCCRATGAGGASRGRCFVFPARLAPLRSDTSQWPRPPR